MQLNPWERGLRGPTPLLTGVTSAQGTRLGAAYEEYILSALFPKLPTHIKNNAKRGPHREDMEMPSGAKPLWPGSPQLFVVNPLPRALASGPQRRPRAGPLASPGPLIPRLGQHELHGPSGSSPGPSLPARCSPPLSHLSQQTSPRRKVCRAERPRAEGPVEVLVRRLELGAGPSSPSEPSEKRETPQIQHRSGGLTSGHADPEWGAGLAGGVPVTSRPHLHTHETALETGRLGEREN